MLSALLLFLSVSTDALAQKAQPRRPNQSTYRPFFPEDPSARNSFACGMGDAGSCLPISRETLNELDQCSESVKIDGSIGDIGFLLMNRYADSVFFQELANRSAAATDCQVQILSANTQPVVDSAWRVFETIQPLLTALVQQRDLESQAQEQELRRMSITASDSAMTGALSRRSSRFESINAAIEQLLGQLPFGEQESTKAAVRSLAGKSISQAQFAAAYRSALPSLRNKYVEAQQTFRKIKNNSTGEYNLNFAQKVELYKAPHSQALLNQLDPKGRSLRCRFDSCYIEGPRNEQFAAMIGLAGVTVLSLGSASPFLAAGVAVGAASLSLTQAYESCSQETLNVTAQIQSSCTPENLAQTTVSQMNRTSCAVNATMLALDVVLPGFAGARRLARAADSSRALASAGEGAQTGLGQLIRSSPDGSKTYRNPEGIEASISASGRKEYKYPNGDRIIEENGVTTTRFADGSSTVRGVDGIITNFDESGTAYSRTLPDGTNEGIGEIVVTGTRRGRSRSARSAPAAGQAPAATGTTRAELIANRDANLQASAQIGNDIDLRLSRTESALGMREGELTDAQRRAVVSSHDVAPGLTYGQYSPAQLREKASLLRFGKTTEELAAARARGEEVVEVFTPRQADILLRMGIAGNGPAPTFATAADGIFSARPANFDPYSLNRRNRVTLSAENPNAGPARVLQELPEGAAGTQIRVIVQRTNPDGTVRPPEELTGYFRGTDRNADALYFENSSGITVINPQDPNLVIKSIDVPESRVVDSEMIGPGNARFDTFRSVYETDPQRALSRNRGATVEVRYRLDDGSPMSVTGEIVESNGRVVIRRRNQHNGSEYTEARTHDMDITSVRRTYPRATWDGARSHPRDLEEAFQPGMPVDVKYQKPVSNFNQALQEARINGEYLGVVPHNNGQAAAIRLASGSIEYVPLTSQSRALLTAREANVEIFSTPGTPAR